VKRVKAAGKPVVTVLMSGRPLVLGPAIEGSDAFVAAWLPGSEGQGVADILFGDCKPTAKLPRAWPSSMAQVHYHGEEAGPPLFPCGFGLTY
jgi:beta-glucosidase